MFITLVAFVGVFSLIPGGILIFILKPRLLPRFDPYFQKRLGYIGAAVPSRRLGRVGMYAAGVVLPYVRRAYFKNLDMRNMVDRNTYVLCLAYQCLVFLSAICIAIFLLYRFMGWL